MGAALLAQALGLPSPALFGALLVGLAYALLARVPLELPAVGTLAAQAVTGVALGSYLRLSTLEAVGSRWPAVLFACATTVALSLAAGLALTRITGVDRPTSSLGMIAGGASGIVAMSGELGADDRLVAVMQYLRVLVVVALTPLVVRVGFGHAPGHAAPAGAPGAPLPVELAFLAGASVTGVLAARLVRLPAGSLLGPLLVAAALTVSGAGGGAQVPGALQAVAFALIGLQVGLRFTPESLRRAGNLLPWVLVAIAGLIVTCAGLAALLVPLAHVSLLDAYLATTPGGLYAVLATAIGSGANTTFVLAVQALRLFAMVLAAPPLVRWLVRRG